MNLYHTVACALAVTAAALFVGGGCAQTKNDKVDNPYEFQMTIENFHRDLRWEEFGRASKATTDGFRQNFLGRYEEHGEDYDIVNLKVENVSKVNVDERRVEVEQKWVVEPNMTVNDEIFVEIWKREDNGWKLDDRMRKREWKRREKRRTRSDDSEASADDGAEPSTDGEAAETRTR